jgi:cyclin-dependent kinase 8/11
MPVDYRSKNSIHDRYKIIGFISSGTYGKVYKAVGRNGQVGEFAIKKCALLSYIVDVMLTKS